MMADDLALQGPPPHLANGSRGRSNLLPYQPHGFTYSNLNAPTMIVCMVSSAQGPSCLLASTFLARYLSEDMQYPLKPTSGKREREVCGGEVGIAERGLWKRSFFTRDPIRVP